MIKPSEVTVIIPHLGADEQQEYAIDQCLYSLKETVPNIEIIVVGNGLNKCRHKDGAKIKISEQGQCKAVNAAVATTNTPWIFVTNDDMQYAPGWWEKFTKKVGAPSLGSTS